MSSRDCLCVAALVSHFVEMEARAVATVGAIALGLLVFVNWRRKKSAEAADRARYDGTFRREPTKKTPWMESEKKGKMSYYYGHHTRPNDGLAQAVYSMDGPRRIDPNTLKPLEEGGNVAAGPRRLPNAPARKPENRLITQYRWSDTPTQARLPRSRRSFLST